MLLIILKNTRIKLNAAWKGYWSTKNTWVKVMNTSAKDNGMKLKVAIYDPAKNYVEWHQELAVAGYVWDVLRFTTM